MSDLGDAIESITERVRVCFIGGPIDGEVRMLKGWLEEGKPVVARDPKTGATVIYEQVRDPDTGEYLDAYAVQTSEPFPADWNRASRE